MPTIAVVDGVKVQVFYSDHAPAHIHATFGGQEALITISNLDVIRGSLPPSRLRRVLDWARENQDALALNWLRCQEGRAREDLAMPAVPENVITQVFADPGTYRVVLTWSNGATTVSRFGHLIGKGVFAPLADPAVFAQVRVGALGRSLEWPGEIDFCADALWFEAHPEDAPLQQSMVSAP